MGHAAPKLIEAVGDYVYGEAPPPPYLKRAFDYKQFGVNVFEMAPGESNTVNSAYNIWKSINGYRAAASQHKTSDWSKRNERAFDITSRYLAKRVGRKNNG